MSAVIIMIEKKTEMRRFHSQYHREDENVAKSSKAFYTKPMNNAHVVQHHMILTIALSHLIKTSTRITYEIITVNHQFYIFYICYMLPSRKFWN